MYSENDREYNNTPTQIKHLYKCFSSLCELVPRKYDNVSKYCCIRPSVC